MRFTLKNKPSRKVQYLTGSVVVLLIASMGFMAKGFIGYIAVALFLLVAVSIMALSFDILPVLLSAVLSAIVLNFFFIPPLYTLHITNSEDILLFLMYLVVALVNAVLTYRIRKIEQKARDKEEKENTIKLYNTLLNSLSHELRTPISTIWGAVDTLKETRDRLSLEQRDELLSEIGIACARLNQQVENLLNMNRLETGMLKLKLDWCDVTDLINSTIEKLDFKRKTILFTENDELPLVKLDSGLMEQVVYNILLNAVLYTPEYATITIETMFENECIILSVSDDGEGFPNDETEHIFDKFYRLSNARTGGSGLGLSISKGYVEAHRGTIIAERNFPTGARFTITIPVESSFINRLKNE